MHNGKQKRSYNSTAEFRLTPRPSMSRVSESFKSPGWRATGWKVGAASADQEGSYRRRR